MSSNNNLMGGRKWRIIHWSDLGSPFRRDGSFGRGFCTRKRGFQHLPGFSCGCVGLGRPSPPFAPPNIDSQDYGHQTQHDMPCWWWQWPSLWVFTVGTQLSKGINSAYIHIRSFLQQILQCVNTQGLMHHWNRNEIRRRKKKWSVLGYGIRRGLSWVPWMLWGRLAGPERIVTAMRMLCVLRADPLGLRGLLDAPN